MKIDILTLFPEMFDIFNMSIIGKAKEKELFEINTINIRDFSKDKHKRVDDYLYGGGSGMLMTPQPIYDAVESVKKSNKGKVVFLGPRGKTFNQEMARDFSKEEELIFLCGHYEGIDERIYDIIDTEVSIGDFILTGGEMAAIPIIDSILRLKEGVLNKKDSSIIESFSENLLEYPQYTRPFDFRGKTVPEVLISGHHKKIENWRRLNMLEITKDKRPDLYEKHTLTKEDKKLLKEFKENQNNNR